eukprot:sb/3474254/
MSQADLQILSKNTTPSANNPYLNPPSPTFAEFSSAVLLDNKQDMHWARYSDWCAPCSVNYTEIVKFETLNIDNLFVLKTHGLSYEGFEWHSNPTLKGSTKHATWRQYFSTLSPELLNLYRERYQQDCELFGYDCEVSSFD